jgi:hypothetical protein
VTGESGRSPSPEPVYDRNSFPFINGFNSYEPFNHLWGGDSLRVCVCVCRGGGGCGCVGFAPTPLLT